MLPPVDKVKDAWKEVSDELNHLEEEVNFCFMRKMLENQTLLGQRFDEYAAREHPVISVGSITTESVSEEVTTTRSTNPNAEAMSPGKIEEEDLYGGEMKEDAAEMHEQHEAEGQVEIASEQEIPGQTQE